MYDPVGAFNRIRELYITYLETAFRISDAKVSAERRSLLEGAGALCTEPLLEPLPEFVEPLLFVAPPLEGVAPAWFDGPPAPVLATCGAHSLFVGGEPEHSQAPPANIATSEGETIHPIFLMVTPSNRLLGPRAP